MFSSATKIQGPIFYSRDSFLYIALNAFSSINHSSSDYPLFKFDGSFLIFTDTTFTNITSTLD